MNNFLKNKDVELFLVLNCLYFILFDNDIYTIIMFLYWRLWLFITPAAIVVTLLAVLLAKTKKPECLLET